MIIDNYVNLQKHNFKEIAGPKGKMKQYGNICGIPCSGSLHGRPVPVYRLGLKGAF